MTATALWAAVVASYPANVVLEQSNLGEPGATTVNTANGEAAAQEVIDLWPVYAQAPYDSANATHVAVGKIATLTMLARKSGKTSSAATVEWDQVFGGDGMIARIKETSARAWPAPASNSGVTTRRENADGVNIRGWSDRESLPFGILPSSMPARD